MFSYYGKRPEREGEEFDPVSKTEQSGYIPPKIQIEQMMYSGQKLSGFRKEMFDLSNGEDDGEIDPTRSKSLDLAEASQMGMEIARKLKARQKRIEERKKMLEEKKEDVLEEK